MKELRQVSGQQPTHRYKRGGHEHVAIPNYPERQFAVTEPNQVWCGDVTCIWTGKSRAYLAVIPDLFTRKPVGWAMSFSPDSRLTMKVLEMSWETRGKPGAVMFHSDKGSQYVSLAYTQRLKEAGLLASTGSTGDSYDNAMAESINGLYKAEVIHRKSWKNRTEVELATLTWVDWYNNRRLLERLGHTPPAEAEKAYYASIGNNDLAA